MSSNHAARRFEPDPRIVRLVEQYGAARVGLMYGMNGDAVRRYLDGASQRSTRWWFEMNLETVARDLGAARPVLVAVPRPSTPPGEGA